MRVILVDDEELALEFLGALLSKIAGVEIVGKFTEPSRAYDALDNLSVDIILLDMEMGSMHGLDFAEKVMNTHSKIEIIFVTAYPQFALEAFEVNAVDYLLKPVRLERLKHALEKANERLTLYELKKQLFEQEKNTIYVYAMGSFRLLDLQGNVVQWRTRKVKELFTYLWHHQAQPVHKARVIEELWPDFAVDKATALLHTTVYQLRQTLKKIGIENAVKLVNDQYILVAEVNSDAKQLTELETKGITEATIEKALDLYTGDYLAEDDYSWAFGEQQAKLKSYVYFIENIARQRAHYPIDNLLYERCLEKIRQLTPTNEENLMRMIHFYGENKERSKLQTLFGLIEKTFESELKMSMPSHLKTKLESYLNGTKDQTNE